ncbi:MAG: DMT family transporter [Marmoricola sp.]
MLGAAVLLAVAIAAEVTSTAMLPRTQSFSSPGWTILVMSLYAFSIWLLAIIVKHIPVSVAYAVWAGVGTAAVAVIGWAFLGEHMSPTKVVSLSLIAVGVVGLNLVGSH